MVEITNDDQIRGAVEILVVDDHREITELVAEALYDEGYSVRIAYDGVTALQAVRMRRPSLLLLDLAMPIMSGDQVLSHLRGCGLHDLPVILMTAERAPERFAALGADQLLRKPFDLARLLQLVGACIGKPVGAAQPAPLQERVVGGERWRLTA